MWKTIISVITVFAMSLCVASCGDDEELGFDSASKPTALHLLPMAVLCH